MFGGRVNEIPGFARVYTWRSERAASSSTSSSSSSSFVQAGHVLLFPLSGCLVPECSGSARFSRSPMGRLIATSADSASFFQYIPTRIPIHLANERGEPDLSPLNGINKLYYACTSPWNTIPVGVLVRTTRGRLCAFKANSRSPISPKLHFRVSCSTLRVWLCAKM